MTLENWQQRLALTSLIVTAICGLVFSLTPFATTADTTLVSGVQMLFIGEGETGIKVVFAGIVLSMLGVLGFSGRILFQSSVPKREWLPLLMAVLLGGLGAVGYGMLQSSGELINRLLGWLIVVTAAPLIPTGALALVPGVPDSSTSKPLIPQPDPNGNDATAPNRFAAKTFETLIEPSTPIPIKQPYMAASPIPQYSIGEATYYLNVLKGTLLGAQPRFRSTETFLIGRGEANQLVLFDEDPSVVAESHAIIYFSDHRAIMQVLAPIRYKGEIKAANKRFALELNAEFEIGNTRVRFMRD